MIRVYLVRHGIAVDSAEKGTLDDSARPLTAKGRRRFRKAAKAFARLGEPLDHIFSSQLVRAVQTAEILVSAVKGDEVGILDELRPDVGVGKLLAEVGRRVKDEEAVALVGHDPQMTALVAVMGNAGKDAELDFRKGSIVRIDVGALPSARPSHPRWWMKPKSRTLEKGLPLRREPKAAAKAPSKDAASKGAAKDSTARDAAAKAPASSARDAAAKAPGNNGRDAAAKEPAK